MDKVLNYFNGDSMAAEVWKSKYQMKNPNNPVEAEETPYIMHFRLAKEFARVENKYQSTELISPAFSEGIEYWNSLSKFGQQLMLKRQHQSYTDLIREFLGYFDHFNQIVPQGSIMSNLGNYFVFGSLSNCFGIEPPLDSYGGIMKADERLAQLMKRRGGVGTHLNNIRPTMARVTNASKSSTGVPTYAERYSNTTREVAQEGRRGALMLLLSVVHPDIFRFVTMKEDRTKVTGANVSVMFTDEFMRAVESELDFVCRFPVDELVILDINEFEAFEYNNLYSTGNDKYVMKIRAKELFEEFVHMAHSNAEPGAAYIDRIIDYSPDGVYEAYMPEVCNPCGEQWFHRNDTCRLIAENLYGIVIDPFTENARIDFDKLYEISYMQQRLGDNLVDLEAEYIDRIIDKIIKDPEPEEVKATELALWKDIKQLALNGRRTGNGFTALGDMLAALLKPYFSPDIIEQVMKKKMEAELDATIDMAILRGPFVGWDCSKEFWKKDGDNKVLTGGRNSFFQMIHDEFPIQCYRMAKYGRRNVSWSTVAPTGTVSIMTQTTSGVEPLFKAYYIRRRKVNPSDGNDVRVDFIDGLGDKWQEYAILHPKFKEWIQVNYIDLVTNSVTEPEQLSKERIQELFEQSPWYGSQAEDLTAKQRIQINAIVQKYTSNSISCTINLPENISENEVHTIYFEGWKAGLKGITVYREGSRDGVLVSEVSKITVDEFGYLDAPERPEVLDADYFFLKHGGKQFGIFVGKLNNNPYEVFAIENPVLQVNTRGEIHKVGSGNYDFKHNYHGTEFIKNGIQNAPLELRKTCRFVSSMLRHRMNPKDINEQIDKAEVLLVDFSKAIQRVLKAYIPDEESHGEACPNCNETTVIYQEGCKRCTSCGHSKC